MNEIPPTSRKTVREYSAGGVVLRRMRGQWHVAAIEPNIVNADSVTRNAIKLRRRPAILALPKGAIDKGESPEQSAIREVLEETGVMVQVIAKLTDIKYFYVRTWGGRERVFEGGEFLSLPLRLRPDWGYSARYAQGSAAGGVAAAGRRQPEAHLSG